MVAYFQGNQGKKREAVQRKMVEPSQPFHKQKELEQKRRVVAFPFISVLRVQMVPDPIFP
jgi:hypothetical protein